MVNELDIPRETKRKLTASLKRFKKLFGGGLGKLDINPINIQLKPELNRIPARTTMSQRHMKNLSRKKLSKWNATTF